MFVLLKATLGTPDFVGNTTSSELKVVGLNEPCEFVDTSSANWQGQPGAVTVTVLGVYSSKEEALEELCRLQ